MTRLRACWCSQDGTEACEDCLRKVYYPDQDAKQIQTFDEEEVYPV